MSKIGVQVQDVFEAADRVLMNGQRPTIERVRQDLGRGSPNTVGPHLEAWYQQLGQRLQGRATPSSEEGGLPPALLALTQQLWQTAREEAAQVLVEQQRQIDAQLAEETRQLKLARQEVTEQARQLQQRETDLNAHIDLLKEQLHLADQRLDESLRKLSEKEVQFTHAQQALAATQQKRQVLESEILRLRDEHESALRQLSSEHHQQLTRWMAEVDRARQERKQHDAEAQQALAAVRQSMQEQVRQFQQQVDELVARVAERDEQLRHKQAQWQETMSRYQTLQQAFEAAQAELALFSQQQAQGEQLNQHLSAIVQSSLRAQRYESREDAATPNREPETRQMTPASPAPNDT